MEHTPVKVFPSVSLIVPIYRAEAFLGQCVTSLLVQTVRDFELLLVDDGSPDGSGALCDVYAAKDSRVRVIHKPNGGVSAARNAGLDAARGDYVVFVDSDDYVDPDHLEQLLALRQTISCPKKALFFTDYRSFGPKGDLKCSYPEPITEDFSAISAQAFRDLVFGFRLFSPCCKLYQRSIIEETHLRFDTSIRTAEDFDCNMRYLAQIDFICYRPIPSYHYRVDYKTYTPSNQGVLGESEIKSAHLMANGIKDLANRMGVYEEVRQDFFRWVAMKHYFNRLPMLFAESSQVGKAERRKLYHRLIADPLYREAAKAGIPLLPKSTTRTICSSADCFDVWYLFYRYQQIRNKLHQAK